MDAVGEVGRRGVECGAQAFGIHLRDGEDADAALMTARSAGEPVTGTGYSGGKGRVEDRKEVVHGESGETPAA